MVGGCGGYVVAGCGGYVVAGQDRLYNHTFSHPIGWVFPLGRVWQKQKGQCLSKAEAKQTCYFFYSYAVHKFHAQHKIGVTLIMQTF